MDIATKKHMLLSIIFACFFLSTGSKASQHQNLIVNSKNTSVRTVDYALEKASEELRPELGAYVFYTLGNFSSGRYTRIQARSLNPIRSLCNLFHVTAVGCGITFLNTAAATRDSEIPAPEGILLTGFACVLSLFLDLSLHSLYLSHHTTDQFVQHVLTQRRQSGEAATIYQDGYLPGAYVYDYINGVYYRIRYTSSNSIV